MNSVAFWGLSEKRSESRGTLLLSEIAGFCLDHKVITMPCYCFVVDADMPSPNLEADKPQQSIDFAVGCFAVR